MQAHTGALQHLTTFTYQRNFDHISASIPIYDRSNTEGFFPWLEHLEAACFYSGRNIKTGALGRSTGPIQNVNEKLKKFQMLDLGDLSGKN